MVANILHFWYINTPLDGRLCQEQEAWRQQCTLSDNRVGKLGGQQRGHEKWLRLV
jgi:hypothetical protein